MGVAQQRELNVPRQYRMRQGRDEPASCRALEWLEATCKALLPALLPRPGLENVEIILTICSYETTVAVCTGNARTSAVICPLMEVGGQNDISVWGFPRS